MKITTSSTTTNTTYKYLHLTYLNIRRRFTCSHLLPAWLFLGLGYTIEDCDKDKPGYDLTPYLCEDAIGPKRMEEVIKPGALVAERKVDVPLARK